MVTFKNNNKIRCSLQASSDKEHILATHYKTETIYICFENKDFIPLYPLSLEECCNVETSAEFH